MRFSSLVQKLAILDPKIWTLNWQHVRITGLTDDSREVMPGNVFAAIPGNKADGTQFIRDALNRGASALLVGKPMPELKLVPQIVTDNPRRTLGHLASLLNGEPSRHMKIIGITGTNGKTTSAIAMR
jgi:UDP-N-acetylmuramoyl-L-alanyl-D-glutamate--2,6-diaminopimelate ligase